MRKKDVIVLILVVAITAALSISVVLTSKRAEGIAEVEALAYEELTTSLENQKIFFVSMLNEKFSALESLAYYIGIIDDLDFPAEREYSDAVMLANHFDAIFLADVNGNSVTYDGRSAGSIADTELFKAAYVRKGTRTVQYSDENGIAGKQAILIAVPVHHRNALTGILYAEIDLSDFDEMLLADNFHGSEAVFVTDAVGNIILRNRNAYGTVCDRNLFEGYLSETDTVKCSIESILSNMSSGLGGSFAYSDDYIVYSPIGVNSWNIFGMVSRETMETKYAPKNDLVGSILTSLCGAFFTLAVCAAAVVMYYINRYYRTNNKLRRKDLILEANDAFMFSDSAQPIKTLSSANIAGQIAERAYGSGSIITSLLNDGKVKVYFVSIGILESLGYTEEEFNNICEKDVSRIIHPDDLAATYEANLKNTNIGDSFQITVRYRRKNGEYLWINEYSHIFRLDDGTVVCASQFVDISKQKELEQQLRAREEEYRIAASMSRYVIMRYEISTRSLTILAQGTCTRKFDNMLTNVPEQAISTGFVAPESIETARRVFDEIDRGITKNGKAAFSFDTGSDSRLWVEMSYSVVFGSNGKPESAILSFIDVTEKRRGEEFINIGSAFLDYATNAKLIIANLTSGLIEYEAPGTIHRCFTELIGSNDIYTIRQYALKCAATPDYVAALSDFLSSDRLIKQFESGNIEEGLDCVVISTDGREKWVNFRVRLARDSYSGDVKAYLVLKDIDKQKNLEQTLHLEKSERRNAAPELKASSDISVVQERQIFARTFGYFDLFVDGKPVHFTNQKEKELLAILIDRNGGTLSAEEAISILWEDEPFGEKQLSRYRKLASRLKRTLEDAGCDDIIITSHGIRHIDVTKIDCDYYEVLNSNSKFIKLYQGIYMLNYSWAEETTASLNRLLLFDEED